MMKRLLSAVLLSGLLSLAQQPAAPKAANKEFTLKLGGNAVPLTLVEIPGGQFRMGSPAEEAYRRPNENAHTVTLTKPFLLGKTEVTQGQWEALMSENPSKHQGDPQLPVENVSWDDAMKFCAALTEQERKAGHISDKQSFTLPTEAQWEYACRAGSTTPFAYGATLDGTQANFDGNHPYGKVDKSPRFLNATAPVGSYAPNAWGLCDMHGNVLEWCRDWYAVELKDAANPAGPADGTYRVYRGGHYRDLGAFCRSAFRYFNLPHFRYAYLGFRVALVQE